MSDDPNKGTSKPQTFKSKSDVKHQRVQPNIQPLQSQQIDTSDQKSPFVSVV